MLRMEQTYTKCNIYVFTFASLKKKKNPLASIHKANPIKMIKNETHSVQAKTL